MVSNWDHIRPSVDNIFASAESIPQDGVLFKDCSLLLAECGSQAQTSRAPGVHSYRTTPIAHGLLVKQFICKLFLPTFKAFLCFYHKRTCLSLWLLVLFYHLFKITSRKAWTFTCRVYRKLRRCKVNRETILKVSSGFWGCCQQNFHIQIFYLIKNRKVYYKKIKSLWQHLPNGSQSHQLVFLKVIPGQPSNKYITSNNQVQLNSPKQSSCFPHMLKNSWNQWFSTFTNYQTRTYSFFKTT